MKHRKHCWEQHACGCYQELIARLRAQVKDLQRALREAKQQKKGKR